MKDKINLFINLAPITKIGDDHDNQFLKTSLPYITRAYEALGCFNLGTDMAKVKQNMRYVFSEKQIN